MNDRTTVVVACLASVLAGAMSPASASALPACGGVRMMSFNICHGAPSYKAEVNLEKTAQTIAAMEADFVCLQEVDNGTTRSGNVDETAYLAEAAGLHGTFAKAINIYGGEYGVAILSKEAPLSVERVSLPDPAADDGYSHENRMLLACEFTNCIVATAHLSLSPDARLSQIGMITNALSVYAKPVFLAGDWNALPYSETLDAICERFDILSPTSGVVTLNTKLPKLADYCIDYISIDKAHRDGWWLRYSEVVEKRDVSDHAPVLIEAIPVPEPLAWIEERAATTLRTGVWTKDVEYDRGTLAAMLTGINAFVAAAPSGGNVVTSTVTVCFSEMAVAVDPSVDAQAAFRLGPENVFQVWTGGMWVDVAAKGLTPEAGVEFVITVVIDYRSGRYSVSVGGKSLASTLNGETSFPLAAPGTAVSAIRFVGDGAFRSLFGEWAQKVNAFMMRIF